jgi:hypothetical protein
MAAHIGTIAPSMALASPDERRRVESPPGDGIGKPLFEHFHVVDMMTFQSPSDTDALPRFGHVEKGGRQ